MRFNWHPIFGKLSGKLSTTPEEAKELFGYEMKPGAKGIYFRVRNGRQEVCSIMPERHLPTEGEVLGRNRFSVFYKMRRELKPLLIDVWDKEAREKGYWDGWSLFMKENFRRVKVPLGGIDTIKKSDYLKRLVHLTTLRGFKEVRYLSCLPWEELDLTCGEGEGPDFSIIYFNQVMRISISNYKGEELGVGALELKPQRFKLFTGLYGEDILIKFSHHLTSPLIVYAYYKGSGGCRYSETVGRRGIHRKVY